MRSDRPFILIALLSLLGGRSLAATPTVTLGRAEYRDRVYACFLGKNIGGTLGMPVEGQRETHQFTYYTPIPTEPAANDDLDLQLLWLKALEDRGPGITCRDLGAYWLQFVPVDWNEYGVGKQNMRDGFPPPLSGQVRNERWRDSNGAWIRSEVWACVAPGCPSLAARYAWEDACVDHGAAEGTWAEVFTATLESAAFVEHDRDKLLDAALSYVPPNCALRVSIAAARKAYAQKLDLMAAREAVVQASASTGWFMAPQNVAFVVLGWLYGEGDFGKSICDAVNCGDDTDCTGATLGSLLGILGGTKSIPDAWRKPVGEDIKNVAIAGFRPPQTLRELTDRVVAMAPQVLANAGYAVRFRETGTAVETSAQEPPALQAMWRRSPYRVAYGFRDFDAELDFGGEPVVGEGDKLPLTLSLEGYVGRPRRVTLHWDLPAGLRLADGASTTRQMELSASASVRVSLVAAAELPSAVLQGRVRITERGRELARLPFALVGKLSVHRSDLALASKGATASSDSELERETGWTSKIIDGYIATPDTFEGHRWHSALTPHPHWVMVTLPRAATVSRVIVHFADPQGRPVDFAGEASEDGKAWRTVFQEQGYRDQRKYEKGLAPTRLRYFRLTIYRSASEKWPNAAQVSELELLP